MCKKNGLESFLKQAKEMQEKIKKVQNDMNKIEIIGQSGAGIVKVFLNGFYNCKKVIIDYDFKMENRKVIEDLVAAAFNSAVHRLEKTKRKKMEDISGKFSL
ncbi:hypothetical protein AOQ88_01040 [Candidatus Riesia sp. GBBU]|nr:hypothetical protein AOQ88_01040 [Candidatus Riesia sp. GBBU]